MLYEKSWTKKKGVGNRCMTAFTQNSTKCKLFYNNRKPENKEWEKGKVYKKHMFLSLCWWLLRKEYVKFFKILLKALIIHNLFYLKKSQEDGMVGLSIIPATEEAKAGWRRVYGQPGQLNIGYLKTKINKKLSV